MMAALTVEAAAQDGQELPLLGQGNVSCSSWIERRAAAEDEAGTMTAWILGYITAFNQYSSDRVTDVSGGQDTDALTGWIDRYCEANPTANLHKASAALVEELLHNARQ